MYVADSAINTAASAPGAHRFGQSAAVVSVHSHAGGVAGANVGGTQSVRWA
jgi:hypothetical protein